MQSAQPAVKVSLRNFKEFVAKNFDETTPFYKVLMREKDEVRERSSPPSSTFG